MGQYEVYAAILEQLEPDRKLFLAVSEYMHQALFVSDIVKLVQKRNQLSMIIVRIEDEKVTTWID